MPELPTLLPLLCLALALTLWRLLSRRTPKVDPRHHVAAGCYYFAPFPFEDQRGAAKDRPVLVLGVLAGRAATLMVTSTDKSGRKEFTPIDTRSWNAPGKGRSFLRTDRVAWIRTSAFRRHITGPAPRTLWWRVIAAHPLLVLLTGRHARR